MTRLRNDREDDRFVRAAALVRPDEGRTNRQIFGDNEIYEPAKVHSD